MTEQTTNMNPLTLSNSESIGDTEACDSCGYPFDPGHPIITRPDGVPYCSRRCRDLADEPPQSDIDAADHDAQRLADEPLVREARDAAAADLQVQQQASTAINIGLDALRLARSILLARWPDAAWQGLSLPSSQARALIKKIDAALDTFG